MRSIFAGGIMLNLCIIAAMCATTLGLPVFAWWFTQRSCCAGFCQKLQGVQPTFMGVVSVMFSLNLVFVCNEIWQAREAAKSAMSRESEALRNIGRIVSGLPDGEGAPLLAYTKNYIDASLACDFPYLPANQKSPCAQGSSTPATIHISEAILEPSFLAKFSLPVQHLLVELLTQIRDKRLERQALLNYTPNWIKWFLLLYLELMTLTTIAVVHVTHGRALFTACFIFLIGVNPFITVLYYSQSPFTGIYPLPPTRLQAALVRITEMEADYLRSLPAKE